MRKLTYLIATTVDGFIAAPDGDFEFFMPYVKGDFLTHLVTEYPETLPTPGRAALGAADAPNKRFDTVVMGRATYDPGLKAGLTSPYAHLRQIVLSRTLTASPDPAVEVTAEDPLTLVRALKQEDGLGIWLCGGASLARQLLPEIDELVVKIYPVVAGSGVPAFGGAEFAPRTFEPVGTESFAEGPVVVTYRKAGTTS
ncbi:dihydrofolate reductase family protein [Kitasatospora sp. NPDC054939]